MDRAIEADAYLIEAIIKSKFESPSKDIPGQQMDGLHKFAENFHVATTPTRTVGTKETTI